MFFIDLNQIIEIEKADLIVELHMLIYFSGMNTMIITFLISNNFTTIEVGH